MERVEEYIRRAKDARQKSANASGAARREYEALAEGWELLAAERLKILEDELTRRETPNGAH